MALGFVWILLFLLNNGLQPPIWTLMENVFTDPLRGMICYYDDINNKIVAFGGSNSLSDNGPKFNNSYKMDLSGTIPYTVEADTIRVKGGSGGIAVNGQTFTRLDNTIYILFGLESNTMNTISSTITTYDFENNIWNTITTNGAIGYMENTCVLGLKNYKGINNVLMVIGGNPDGAGLTNKTYYLNVNVGTWILDDGSLPTKRNGHSCVMINETIYVVAGIANTIFYGKPGSLFEIMLNSNNQQFTTYPAARQKAIYVRDDINGTDLIYIIGGIQSDHVEIIDVIARKRVALYFQSPPNSISRGKEFHCLVSDGLRLFIIGGLDGTEVLNEIEYTNTFTMSPTLNPTESTLTPTQQTSTPTQQTLMPTIGTTTPTQETLIPTQLTFNPTQESSSPTQQTFSPSQLPTISTNFPSKSPTFSPPTSTPSQSPSLSCDEIKITTLSKTQNDIPSIPICTSTIPCEWELSYIKQDANINDRPEFKSSTNEVIISYTSNSWSINFDISRKLSLTSGTSFPPNNLYWQLSTNNNIRFQLKIECTTITTPAPTVTSPASLTSQVLDPTNPFFYIAIVLILLLILILIIVVYMCCCRKKEKGEASFPNGRSEPAVSQSGLSQMATKVELEAVPTEDRISITNNQSNTGGNYNNDDDIEPGSRKDSSAVVANSQAQISIFTKNDNGSVNDFGPTPMGNNAGLGRMDSEMSSHSSSDDEGGIYRKPTTQTDIGSTTQY